MRRWNAAAADVAADRPVLLLHGFTQTASSWAPVAERLAATGRDVVAVDLPGHGEASAVRAGLVGAARLVHRTMLRAVGAAAVDVVGYSMGGRVALHVALGYPDVVRRLVLLGASPGIDDPAERAARQAADERLADRLLREGVAPFLDRWLSQPLFAGLSPEAAGAEERLAAADAEGLAASLRLSGTGAQAPLWSRLASIRHEVLVLAGEHDAKFRAIGERTAAAIGDRARVDVVAGAGHAAHLEQPARFTEAVVRFLSV